MEIQQGLKELVELLAARPKLLLVLAVVIFTLILPTDWSTKRKK